ncbi:MAG: hypothetical protein ACFB50_17400 [Rubrobacteraceae bacterium]
MNLEESGEPNHAGNPGGNSIWYEWTAPSDGGATVSTGGSGFDTILGVYTGDAADGLKGVSANDYANGSERTSEVSFEAKAGTTYMIAVDGYKKGSENPAAGNVELQVQLEEVASDTIAPNTRITSGSNGTRRSGNATFRWRATDNVDPSGDLRYQYRLDGRSWSSWTTKTRVRYRNLSKGPHTFETRAKDSSGNVEGTPATREWRVR